MKTSFLFSIALVFSLSACSGQASRYIGTVTRTYSEPGKTDWVVRESGKGITVFTSGNTVVVEGLSFVDLVFERTLQADEWALDPTLSAFEQGEGTTAAKAEYSPETRIKMTYEQGRATVMPGYVQIDAIGTRLDEDEVGATDVTRVTIKFSGLKW